MQNYLSKSTGCFFWSDELSVCSSLPVLLSGICCSPMVSFLCIRNPPGSPLTQNHGQISSNEGNEGSLWEPSPGIRSIGIYSSCLLFLPSQSYLRNLLCRVEVEGIKFTETAQCPMKRSCHLTRFLFPCPTHLPVDREQHGSDSRD